MRLLRMRERFANVLFILEHGGQPWDLFKMATPEATVPEATLTKFKDELTCSLCNELFREPKTLFCLHTFCEECLSNHITKRVVDTDPQAGDSREKVSCPLCQYVQELPEADIRYIKTNHLYKNLVSHFSIEERVRTAHSLDEGCQIVTHANMENHTLPKENTHRACRSEFDHVIPKCKECEEGHAVAFCEQCVKHFCKVCATSHVTLFETHEVFTLERILSSSEEDGEIMTYKNIANHLLPQEGVYTACSSEPYYAILKCEGCYKGCDAITFCKACNKHLCTSCTAAHSTLNIFKTHEVLSLEEISSLSKEGGQIVTHHTWKCSKHDDLNLEDSLITIRFYCKPCDELICAQCGIIEPHRHHMKYMASEIINEPECKPKIQQHETEVKHVQEKFTMFISEMESLKMSLEENREKAKAEINKKFQDLQAKLEEEKEALLQKVEKIFEQKNELFLVQVQELRDIEREMAESRKFVNDTLTFGTPEEVLFLKTQMITCMVQLRDKYDHHRRIPQENDIITFEENKTLDLTGAIGTVSADPFPPQFTADTLSKVHFIQGEEASITITCRDIAGTPRPIKHDLKVEMCPEASGDVIRGEVRERNEVTGEYTIVLKPLTHGNHKLKISVVVGDTDVPIAGSPFSIAVSPPLVHKLQPQKVSIPNMGNPWGVAVNEDGIIVISDIGKHMLVVVSPDNFEVIRQIGRRGNQEVEFKSPCGLAFTSDSDIAVVDKGNHRVQFVSLEGDYKGHFGREGDGYGEFRGATDVAISLNGNIFVSDATLNRIQYFTPRGDFIGTCGCWGAQNAPYAITFDAFGRILITEQKGNCVAFYKNVQESGEDIACSSTSEQPRVMPQFTNEFVLDFKTNVTFSEPVGIVFDPITSYIVVTELRNHRISILNKNGEYICSLGTEGKLFTFPMGIATCTPNNSRFIVCNCGKAEVIIFNIV